MHPPRDPTADTARARAYWEASHAGTSHPDTFLDHPLIQYYVSMRAFGDPTPHFDRAVAAVRAYTRPGSRVLSLCCGAAINELALARALPDRSFVGVDVAAATLERARETVRRSGISNLELAMQDCNHLRLERAGYDVVLGLAALHHIAALEDLWAVCRQALRPGGVVVAQEYVGPNRFQWTPLQVELATRLLDELVPAEHKVHHARAEPPPLAEMLALDPSEAVRAAEIVPSCRGAGFRLTHYFGGGCGVLLPALIYQMHTFASRDWSHNLLLMRLFAAEEQLQRQHEVPDCYAMFVAVPPAAE